MDSDSGGAPEPSLEAEIPTDTLWVGRIPVNLVGGDSAMTSMLNINANKNISSLFSQFGKVKHSTVRVKPGTLSKLLIAVYPIALGWPLLCSHGTEWFRHARRKQIMGVDYFRRRRLSATCKG